MNFWQVLWRNDYKCRGLNREEEDDCLILHFFSISVTDRLEAGHLVIYNTRRFLTLV